MTVLKHEKSGQTVDVSGDVLKLYTKHGWHAVDESEATDPDVEADAKSEAGDADGSDAGEGETSARQTTKRGANTKG